MVVKTVSRMTLVLVVLGAASCGGTPLKVAKSGAAGNTGAGGSGAGGSGGSAGTSGTGAAGQGDCTSPPCGPDCSTLDEGTCKNRSDCEAAYCPDCMGGQRFNGCVVLGSGGSCPPSCSPPPPPTNCEALNEMQCKANSYCHPGYCSTCSGAQKFNVCLRPMEVAPCPDIMCPAVGPCSSVTDQLLCQARIDCHPVFGKCMNCPCPTAGCAIAFIGCADGEKAACNGMPSCHRTPPDCTSQNTTTAYVVSYAADCYEGCVPSSECGP